MASNNTQDVHSIMHIDIMAVDTLDCIHHDVRTLPLTTRPTSLSLSLSRTPQLVGSLLFVPIVLYPPLFIIIFNFLPLFGFSPLFPAFLGITGHWIAHSAASMSHTSHLLDTTIAPLLDLFYSFQSLSLMPTRHRRWLVAVVRFSSRVWSLLLGHR